MRVAALLLLFAAVQGVAAQQVRGRLLDQVTSRPIPAAVVTLFAADSIVQRAISDAEGRWQLSPPGPGRYRIGARRLGFQPWISGELELTAETVLDSVVRMSAIAVQLDPIAARAAATRRNLEYNGFFERQRGNFGHFISPDAIDRRQAARLTDLLSAVPGVQLMTSGGGSAGATQIGLRGSSSGLEGGLCRPRVFVDGLMYTRGDSRPVRVRSTDATEQADLEERVDRALSLDDIGHPSTIAGIEVYRSATQVPVQFGGTSVETLCGVIVIWTRTGRSQGEPRR
jgi:hypothetical protein